MKNFSKNKERIFKTIDDFWFAHQFIFKQYNKVIRFQKIKL
jgi:hypothetical protein